MKNDFIYDIETYPNVFTCAVEHAASDACWFFELSEERDDIQKFREFIQHLTTMNARMVGYNNIGFDYTVIHLICKTLVTVDAIYNKSQSIINSDHNKRFANMVWESDWIVDQIDLYKIHHFDNVARATSLKVLEFNMRSRNIEDLPFEPGTMIRREDLPMLRKYNKHDVSETKKFYFETVEAIEMRENLSAKYGKNFLNHNDTKIGKDYFIMKLEERLPGSTYYRDHNNRKQPRQTVRPSINLSDVVFPHIQFEQSEFNRILDYFKSQTITETKGVFTKLKCTINDFDYHFGVGGIHGSVDSQIVEADENFMIIDIDVASYYPNLAIANRLYPEHLSEQFCDIYLDVYNQRKEHQKGTPENAMLKLALNGVYGDSNNKYSVFYDPAYTMSITINGQLLLCMLAEQLIKSPDLSMIQINTDGLTVRIPRHLEQWVSDVCRWWESVTRLELESVEYSRMFVKDVNNYIAEYE